MNEIRAAILLRFYFYHLGSTNGLTDSTGTLTASNSYDSFGNPTNASFPTRYQFTGREFDSTTGLQFSRARWYDPAIGRFISEDPIGLRAGMNLYSYVANQPHRFSDPLGLFPSIWPFDYHQTQTKYGLNGLATPDQINQLAQADADFDARTQDPIYAPYHAMRRPGQSVDEARAESNEFVRGKICMARQYSAEGRESDALNSLGIAMHTMQDAHSPSHVGFQEAWPDAPYGFGNLLHFGHYLKETLLPGKGATEAEEETRRLWMYYQGRPMPDDFFGDSNGGLSNCGCP